MGIHGDICSSPLRSGIWREISKMATEEIEVMDVDLDEKGSTSTSASTSDSAKESTSTGKRKGFQLPW